MHIYMDGLASWEIISIGLFLWVTDGAGTKAGNGEVRTGKPEWASS